MEAADALLLRRINMFICSKMKIWKR